MYPIFLQPSGSRERTMEEWIGAGQFSLETRLSVELLSNNARDCCGATHDATDRCESAGVLLRDALNSACILYRVSFRLVLEGPDALITGCSDQTGASRGAPGADVHTQTHTDAHRTLVAHDSAAQSAVLHAASSPLSRQERLAAFLAEHTWIEASTREGRGPIQSTSVASSYGCVISVVV